VHPRMSLRAENLKKDAAQGVEKMDTDSPRSETQTDEGNEVMFFSAGLAVPLDEISAWRSAPAAEVPLGVLHQPCQRFFAGLKNRKVAPRKVPYFLNE
jgi:hypothetical protein